MIPSTALKNRVSQNIIEPIQVCINSGLKASNRNSVTERLCPRCYSCLPAVGNNGIVLKVIIDRQSWIMSSKTTNDHGSLIDGLLIIPGIRIDINTVGDTEPLALRDITAELIVNSAAKRWSTKPNAQDSEINTRCFDRLPVNAPLVFAHINTLRSGPIWQGVQRQQRYSIVIGGQAFRNRLPIVIAPGIRYQRSSGISIPRKRKQQNARRRH